MHAVWFGLINHMVSHTEFTNIFRVASIEAIIWLPQYQWSKPGVHVLTLQWLGHFFSKRDLIFWCCSPYEQYFYMELVQYNECLVSIVDTDGLVL